MKKYEKFHNQNKSIVVKYFINFLFIIVDLLSFLVCFDVGGLSPTEDDEKSKDEKSNTWILMLPLLAEWAITLGFYIHLKKRKQNIKKKIKKLIDDKKNSIKCFSKERAKQFRKTLKLQEKNYNNSYFEKFLFNVMLYIFPILLKLIVFKKLGFQRKYNKELLNDIKNKNKYQSLEVVVDNQNNSMNLNEDNNVSLRDIEIDNICTDENTIYERNKKMKSKYGEISYHISFLIVKVVLEILFIIYLTRIGEKFDDLNASCSWTILFIPFYLLLLPVLLFCILHCLSLYKIFKKKIWIPIITVTPCLLSFTVNCVIIPLKLDKKISLHQAVIPIIFLIGTIFLIAHLLILKKYKKSER